MKAIAYGFFGGACVLSSTILTIHGHTAVGFWVFAVGMAAGVAITNEKE